MRSPFNMLCRTGFVPLALCLLGWRMRSASSFAPLAIQGWTKPPTAPSVMLSMAMSDEADVVQQRQQDRLLSLLSFIQNRQEGRIPCGLDANEREQELVASVVNDVEQEVRHNRVAKQNGKIEYDALKGDWKLLYTSSRTMIINRSLSGLGRSSSKYSQFVSLVQKLGGNKFLGTVEFIEVLGEDTDTILVVSITGECYLKPETNLFTSTPTTAIAIEPKRVVYGPSSNAGEDWASLGPIKLLDLLYLSEDVMISRGNVNPDALFVWQRLL